jgi:hypothetical protein
MFTATYNTGSEPPSGTLNLSEVTVNAANPVITVTFSKSGGVTTVGTSSPASLPKSFTLDFHN